MGDRRKARECALQMLFQIDMTGDRPVPVRRSYWSSNPVAEPVRAYADRLVEGTCGDLPRIDGLVEKVAKNWRLDRMALVDRNVLRLATYELLHEHDTPHKVVINEAIEVVRKFSSEESAHFVNGVLDAIRREIDAIAPPRVG